MTTSAEYGTNDLLRIGKSFGINRENFPRRHDYSMLELNQASIMNPISNTSPMAVVPLNKGTCHLVEPP